MFCNKCLKENVMESPVLDIKDLKEAPKHKCLSCSKEFIWLHEKAPKFCLDCMNSRVIAKSSCQWCGGLLPPRKTYDDVDITGKKKKKKEIEL